MIFGTPKGIDKQRWKEIKEESKTDKQLEKVLTRLKDSGELEQRVRALSHEALHIVHNFLEKEEKWHEAVLDGYTQHANENPWFEILGLVVESDVILTPLGAGIGTVVGADPVASSLIGFGVGTAAAYPIWKWLAKKDVQRNEKKTEFLAKLRELIEDEWKQRGSEGE